MTTRDPDDKERTSLHEAGHAVVAWSYGVGIGSIRLDTKMKGVRANITTSHSDLRGEPHPIRTKHLLCCRPHSRDFGDERSIAAVDRSLEHGSVRHLGRHQRHVLAIAKGRDRLVHRSAAPAQPLIFFSLRAVVTGSPPDRA